jgi:hypothetical protein
LMQHPYILMMRTTIRLDDRLLAEAKQLAARTGTTLTAVIEDALRQKLMGSRKAGARKPLELPTCGGRGLQPGIDLDDSASLLEAMDAPV